MHVQHHYTVPTSPSMALAVHRDEVEEYGARFPGVAAVTLGSPFVGPDGLWVAQHWLGDLRVIPAPLRALITEERFRWRIDTCWAGRACDWALTVPVLGDAPLIEGRYVFQADPAGTRVSLDASLAFSPEAVGARLGVSRWQAWLLPVLERFVGMLFAMVLEHSARVICAHVAQEAAAA